MIPPPLGSRGDEDVDRMAHVMAERASGYYPAKLIEVNPQLLAEEHVVYNSIHYERKAEGIR